LEKPLSTSFSAIVHYGRRERIVAAGIEHHEAKRTRAADGRDDLLQRHASVSASLLAASLASTGTR
jgi:hypothetical protein